jgi:hypothetical protein
LYFAQRPLGAGAAGGGLLSSQTFNAAPTWRLRGNAILIESKDDIRKRLSSSTDDADAAVLAWHKRTDALRRQMRPRLDPIGLGWSGMSGGTGWMAS